jgi:hypothetical protein
MYQANDKVKYSGAGRPSISNRLTVGRIYRVQSVDPSAGEIGVTDDRGLFLNAPEGLFDDPGHCGGIQKGDEVVITNPRHASPSLTPYGMTYGYRYRVIDIDRRNDTVNIQDDNGLDSWISHDVLDIHYPQSTPYIKADSDSVYDALQHSPIDIDWSEPKRCSCPMREMMMYGCQCGAFQAEQRRKGKANV